ncbi:hypothetical protein [Geodermatophilus sp. SYSU D01119]
MLAPPTPAPASRRRPSDALRHVALAAVLGAGTALAGTPLVVGALFGGWPVLLPVLGVLVAAVSALAVALDRAAGPRAEGSAGRGVAVGVLGTLGVVVLAVVAIAADLDAVLPVPLRYAAAGLPYAVVAALQWRGPVRVVTAGLVAVAVAAVAVPAVVDASRRHAEERVRAEVGTTAHPWVTDVDGLRQGTPQATGSDLVRTPYRPADGALEPELWLSRGDGPAPGTGAPVADPCAAREVLTPAGYQPVGSCTPAGEDRWLRTAGTWRELLTRDGPTWIGVTTTSGAPLALLEEALERARPMTDDEYDAWLDEVLPPPR